MISLKPNLIFNFYDLVLSIFIILSNHKNLWENAFIQSNITELLFLHNPWKEIRNIVTIFTCINKFSRKNTAPPKVPTWIDLLYRFPIFK